MGNLGHTFLFEAGGISALGGVFPHTLPNQADGSLLLSDIENAIRPDDIHDPITRMVILENTHNRCGGTVLTPEYTQSVAGPGTQASVAPAPGRGADLQCRSSAWGQSCAAHCPGG